jgi:PIN domain nuclease of toxin-antitoxin system
MIILDTCTLLWLVHDPERLTSPAREALRATAGCRAVSAASAWEIAIKSSAGKLRLPSAMTPAEWFLQACHEYGITELPVGAADFCRAVALPPIHRDPCDRLIVATALAHHARVVTADTTIPRYPGVTVVW